MTVQLAILTLWGMGLILVLGGVSDRDIPVVWLGVVLGGVAMSADAVLHPASKPAPAFVASVWIGLGVVATIYIAIKSRIQSQLDRNGE